MGRGVAGVVPVAHHVPVLIPAVDPHLRAVGYAGDNGGAGVGTAAEVERAAPGVNGGVPGVGGPDEGDAEVVRQAQDQVPGDLREVVLNPPRILHVVVVAQLQQYGGELGVAHLPQAGGGAGDGPVGQGVDLPQVVDKNLGSPLALGAGGVVEGDDPPHAAVVAGPRRVGMEGQIEVIPPLVGLADGASGGHVGCIALVADAAAVEIGDHGVRQAVHPVLLAAGAGDIGVIFLRTGRYIMKMYGKKIKAASRIRYGGLQTIESPLSKCAKIPVFARLSRIYIMFPIRWKGFSQSL